MMTEKLETKPLISELNPLFNTKTTFIEISQQLSMSLFKYLSKSLERPHQST